MTLIFVFSANYELPEFALVRELVYVFQGIEGKYIRFDTTRDTFKVDRNVSEPRFTSISL